jgi:hypothetical protein
MHSEAVRNYILLSVVAVFSLLTTPVDSVPLGPSGYLGGGGGSSGCSNSLDLTKSCNSQYINVVGM